MNWVNRSCFSSALEAAPKGREGKRGPSVIGNGSRRRSNRRIGMAGWGAGAGRLGSMKSDGTRADEGTCRGRETLMSSQEREAPDIDNLDNPDNLDNLARLDA